MTRTAAHLQRSPGHPQEKSDYTQLRHNRKHEAKNAAVTPAFQEHLRRRRQLEIVSLFSIIDFDPKYDYKAERRKRHRR